MGPRIHSWTLAAVLALAAAVGLQVAAIHTQSLSGDGAYHLLAGHQALRYGTNNLNLEHPPLAKLVISLPLLLEDEPLAPPTRIEDALRAANHLYGKAELVRRATVRGRYVELAVFVLPFLAACFLLGRRFGGTAAGIVLVLLTSLSLSVLPYLTLLQTDTGVCLAFLLTLLAAMRYREEPGFLRAALVGAAAGLGLAVKFSALLLGPTVLVAFALAAKTAWRRRLGELLVAGVAVVLVVEGVYAVANPGYDRALERETIRTYCANRGTLAVDREMAAYEGTLLAVENVDPRLAQWLTGFLGVQIQNRIGVYPSYAFGQVRSKGRWWYFPVVLLVKTPLVVLLAALAAAVSTGLKTRAMEGKTPEGASRKMEWILVGVTVVVYLVASVTSNYNLGVRHLLPVIPLLYLPLAVFLGRQRRWAAAVVGILLLESLAVAPDWMAATNTWWLGEKNPTRFALGESNVEYRQSFLSLARYAEKKGLEPLYVLYPTLGDEVLQPYLPDAKLVRPGDEVRPGWYAVNVTVEQLVPALLKAPPGTVYNYDELHRAAERWDPFWQSVVAAGEDHGWVAGTYHLYRLP